MSGSDDGQQPFRTDLITLRAVAALLPVTQDHLASKILDETPFMTEFGPYEVDDPAIESITIHAWARRRIIADIRFRGGGRYVDGTITSDAEFPETIRAAVRGGSARRIIDHPIFEGVDLADDQKDKPSDFHVATEYDRDLGRKPGLVLVKTARALSGA